MAADSLALQAYTVYTPTIALKTL